MGAAGLLSTSKRRRTAVIVALCVALAAVAGCIIALSVQLLPKQPTPTPTGSHQPLIAVVTSRATAFPTFGVPATSTAAPSTPAPSSSTSDEAATQTSADNEQTGRNTYQAPGRTTVRASGTSTQPNAGGGAVQVTPSVDQGSITSSPSTEDGASSGTSTDTGSSDASDTSTDTGDPTDTSTSTSSAEGLAGS